MQRFSAFHPLSSFLYFAAVICITMFSRNPLVIALSFFGAALFSVTLKAFHGVWMYLLIFLLTTLTNPLFSHNGATPLFFLNGNPITLEAIIYGAYLGGMIAATLLWFSCYNKVITTDKFLCLFGTIMPKAALVVSMALRLVPRFIADGRNMVEIQNSIDSGKGLKKKIKKHVAVFSCLITRSLEGAVEQTDSMKARGYGERKRVGFSRFRFAVSDIVLISFTAACFMFIVFFGGALDFNYYPKTDDLFLNPAYLICIVFFILPSVINLWSEIKWKFWISKV